MRTKRLQYLYLVLTLWVFAIIYLFVHLILTTKALQEKFGDQIKNVEQRVKVAEKTVDFISQVEFSKMARQHSAKPVKWQTLSAERYNSLKNLSRTPKKYTSEGHPVYAVLVIACNRVTVRKCIDRLIEYRPSKEQFPIIVAQDCTHRPTTDVILSYEDSIHWLPNPDQRRIETSSSEARFKEYYKIARHYKYALNFVFSVSKFDTAIIIEDDLLIAPDFFEYFMATKFLLLSDPTVWCVSAWNDNGFEDAVDISHPETLYRTDLFPGLGWMMTRNLWEELKPKWPLSYWDDWMRNPLQRKNRVCIRPEISRTFEFSEKGASNGTNKEFLKRIKLNNRFCNFTTMDLSYLSVRKYDAKYFAKVYNSMAVNFEQLLSFESGTNDSVRIVYRSSQEFRRIASAFKLMEDLHDGVPRTGYKGIVTFWQKTRRVYIVPSKLFKARSFG